MTDANAVASDLDEIAADTGLKDYVRREARAAADLLRSQAERVRELEEALENRDEGLHRIEQWAEAYPVDIFTPVPPADLKRADKLLNDAGISMSAIHGGWARHILDGVAGICRAARARGEP